jgi:hypothetical protein
MVSADARVAVAARTSCFFIGGHYYELKFEIADFPLAAQLVSVVPISEIVLAHDYDYNFILRWPYLQPERSW